MKDRSVKTEQYKLWFYDLEGTAQLLGEKSLAGWHLSSVDVDSGRFTYKRGEPVNFFYEIVVNGGTKNLAVYTDAFEKVCEATGLTFYRKKEDAKEGYSTETHSFNSGSVADEEEYLAQKANDGYVLLRCARPEYTFAMCEKSDIKYKIDYREQIDNPEEYIKKYEQAGFEYLWGYNGYHYFCTENAENSDDTVFDETEIDESLKKKKNREFESIFWVALVGMLAAFIKAAVDFKNYSSATAQDIIQSLSKSMVMDIAAAAVCLVFLLWVIIKRRRGK